MTTPPDRGTTTAQPKRRTWWLAGRTVPGVVATTLGYGSFSTAMIAMTVRDARAGGRLPGLSAFFSWAFALFMVLSLISAAATIVALNRHPGLVRWPANPLRPNRARWVVDHRLGLGPDQRGGPDRRRDRQ